MAASDLKQTSDPTLLLLLVTFLLDLEALLLRGAK